MILFLHYPKCTTCQKAHQWLKNHDIDIMPRDIVMQNPTVEELSDWVKKSGKHPKSFFNTSGLKYKALGLKDTLPTLSEDKLLEILSSDGMLVKRPLLICKDTVMIGFKEKEWEEYFRK